MPQKFDLRFWKGTLVDSSDYSVLVGVRDDDGEVIYCDSRDLFKAWFDSTYTGWSKKEEAIMRSATPRLHRWNYEYRGWGVCLDSVIEKLNCIDDGPEALMDISEVAIRLYEWYKNYVEHHGDGEDTIKTMTKDHPNEPNGYLMHWDEDPYIFIEESYSYKETESIGCVVTDLYEMQSKLDVGYNIRQNENSEVNSEVNSWLWFMARPIRDFLSRLRRFFA